MEREFSKFSKFRESENSETWIGINLKILSLICVFWHCGNALVSNTRGCKFEFFYLSDKYFCHWIQWKHFGKTELRWVVCWIHRNISAVLVAMINNVYFFFWFPDVFSNHSSNVNSSIICGRRRLSLCNYFITPAFKLGSRGQIPRSLHLSHLGWSDYLLGDCLCFKWVKEKNNSE